MASYHTEDKIQTPLRGLQEDCLLASSPLTSCYASTGSLQLWPDSLSFVPQTFHPLVATGLSAGNGHPWAPSLSDQLLFPIVGSILSFRSYLNCHLPCTLPKVGHPIYFQFVS